MDDKKYKEFDREIRSMMADAEEAVPQHLADDVFARLDAMEGKTTKKVIPLWLKYIGAGLAVAASLVLAIVLWPEQTSVVEKDGEITAMTIEETKPETEKILLADNSQEAAKESVKTSVKYRPQAVVETENDACTEDNNRIEEDTDKLTEKTITEEVTTVEEVTGDTPEKASEKKDSDDSQVDPFALMEWEDQTRQASVVSLTVGGDVSSNGDPSGLLRSNSLRAPEQLVNAEWVEQTSKESSYSIPVSFGVGARIALGKRWGLNTGLKYSLLQRTFAGTYTKITDGKTVANISSDIRHTIHYIGIPLQGYFDIIDGSKVKLYAYAGGEAEKALANVYRIKNQPKDVIYRENVKGVQLSVNAGFGIEFAVAKQLGLYINPGLAYYFDCDQPVSIRTQQPLMMNFEVGMRVKL